MVYHRTICTLLTLSLTFTGCFPLQALAADLSAPSIVPTVQQPFDKENGTLRIEAKVDDDQSLSDVVLRYRTLGSTSPFQSLPMERQGLLSLFKATLKSDKLSSPGIEYYIEARDEAGNISQQPFPSHPRTVAIDNRDATSDASGKINWLWVGLGVLVIGALAGGSSGGGSGGDSSETGNSLTVTAPTP